VAERDGNVVTVEVSAVNRKHTDVRLTLPRELAGLEPHLRTRVQDATTRGALNVVLTYQLSSAARAEQLRIDMDLAVQGARLLQELAERAGLDTRISLRDVLELPGVLLADETPAPGTVVEELALEALDLALVELRAMQRREAETLAADLRERTSSLARILDAIRAAEPEVLPRYRQRLLERIQALDLDVTADDERLLKEVAFMAERCDITEELVRLQSHVDQLDELLQIAGLSLEFRAELGRIREQINNLE
jgi:uncharacterized protein (TIGR00255 family)